MMKLRKHINVILAFLLLVSNMGLAFNVHYCEGKISGISFSYEQEEPCLDEKPCEIKIEKSCCAVADSHDSCCENDKIDIKKTTTENVILKSVQLDVATFVLQEHKGFEFLEGFQETILKSDAPAYYCETNAPPLYKLHSQLIFYDSIIS